MEIKSLYKYTKGDSIIISTEKPSYDNYEIRKRLIAKENFALTKNNEDFYQVIDVESAEGWYEVEYDFESEY